MVAPVSVRLNPDVEADTHAYVATGSARSKFGLGFHDALTAYERAAAHPALEPVGLSFHVGSQLLDPDPVHAAAAKAAELWREAGLPLRDLDVGGGLGIGYDGEEDAEVEPYAAALLRGRGRPGRRARRGAGPLARRPGGDVRDARPLREGRPGPPHRRSATAA